MITRRGIALLSATLQPALQGELDPKSGALEGNLEDWKTVVLTPGAHPLEELAVRIALLNGYAAGAVLRELEEDHPGLAGARNCRMTQRYTQAYSWAASILRRFICAKEVVMKTATVLAISLATLLLVSCTVPQATPTPTSLSRTAPTVIAESGDKEWTLVVLSDSVMSGFANRYAARLEQDLDVNIATNVHSRSGWPSQGLLDALRDDEILRQDLCEADVIVFHIPRGWFGQYCGHNYDVQHVQECGPQAVEAYNADVDAIIAEIVALRNPSDALIRTMDAYSHWRVSEAKRQGSQELFHRYWTDANEHLAQVATEYHIPVARVYAAFNGPDGDVDPVNTGYLGTADVTHTTEQGKDLLADLVRELGYEYAPEQ